MNKLIKIVKKSQMYLLKTNTQKKTKLTNNDKSYPINAYTKFKFFPDLTQTIDLYTFPHFQCIIQCSSNFKLFGSLIIPTSLFFLSFIYEEDNSHHLSQKFSKVNRSFFFLLRIKQSKSEDASYFIRL